MRIQFRIDKTPGKVLVELKEASKNFGDIEIIRQGPERITAEIADLWFHCIVLLARHGLGPQDVLAELARREGTSGHAEKNAR